MKQFKTQQQMIGMAVDLAPIIAKTKGVKGLFFIRRFYRSRETGKVRCVACRGAESIDLTLQDLFSPATKVFHPPHIPKYHLKQTHRDKRDGTGWIVTQDHDEWAVDGTVYKTRMEAFELKTKLEISHS